MTDFCDRSAFELARAITVGETTSSALVERYLARIEARNPALNAVVTLDTAGARASAAAADEATARGERWGPLHGVPITVKDTLETAGMRTTAGFPPLADHVPAADATVVARIRAAGAIVMGKTNVPVLASDWQSYNPIFGTTRNPWDPARTPGGSSGGATAAIAAGLSALEIGSDIGGSIRTPSGWCGVYGHKPSHGIVPLRGHIPGPPGALAEPDLAVAGPIARSAGDLDRALALMAGPSEDRRDAWTLALPPPRRASLRDYRVAAWLDDAACSVDDAVCERLNATVQALRSAGVTVDEHARPGFSLTEVTDVYLRLVWPILLMGFPPDSIAGFAELAARFPADSTDHTARMARYGTARHIDWLGANEVRERMRRTLAELFESYDVLLLPIAPVPAILRDESEPPISRVITTGGASRPYYDLFAWIALASATWHPATAAPIGRTKDGLPVGVQIVAPYLEDRTSIDFAARLADVIGGFEPAP